MKIECIFARYCAVLAVVLLGSCSIYCQNKTIVLVRHAERAADTDMNKGDPELSAEGRERALRLVKIVRKYKPHEIFSSDFKRARQTAEPIAVYRGKQVQIYDPKKPADLVQKMMTSKTEHYLIVGHSNTIPALANLLMKKQLFQSLDDSEYGAIWVVKIRNGSPKKVEVLAY